MNPWWPRSLSAGTALVSALTLAACGTAAPAPEPPSTTTAPPATPPGEVEVVSETQLAALLREAPGHLRVVNFWAMWCPPCVKELSGLGQFAEEHPEVELVLVNLDLPGAHGRIPRFLEQRGVGGARVVALDSRDPATAMHQMSPDWPDAIPVTWIIRADGTVAARYARAVTPEELSARIAP